MWTIFHHLKHEHRYCKWVSDLYSPIFLSPRAVTTSPPPASWGQQLWSSVLGQARVSQEPGLGAHCVTSSQGDGHGRTEDGLTLPRAPSVLTPHGFSGQHSPLQWQGLRTCDGLTLTRGDIGGWGSSSHGQNIFRWGSLNFKTTGRTKQNYYGAYILSLGLKNYVGIVFLIRSSSASNFLVTNSCEGLRRFASAR